MANTTKFVSLENLTLYDEKIKKVITDGDAVNSAAAQTAQAAAEAAQATADKNAEDIIALQGRVKTAEDDIDIIETNMGDVDELSTTNKTFVGAINEVLTAVGTGGTAAVVTIDTNVTTEGALKSYTIKQGEGTVGVIDIPKDMVVESGEVVVDPEGQDEGTYIKLVLTNVAEPLYINVGALIDIYEAQENATQIQLAIDSSTREISATIVAGSVGTTELADDAVTTVKIADTNVTLAKLSTGVQASLAKADSAVQSVVEGTANGTINVDGTDVPVHGLGSAAYKDETAFDAAGAASAVQDKLNEEIERAKAAEAKALEDANKYTDEKIGDVDLSGIAENAEAIAAIEESLAEGGTVANKIAEAKKAGTDAQANVETLSGTVDTLSGKVTDNETNISGHADRLTALEAKVGEGFEAVADSDILGLFN